MKQYRNILSVLLCIVLSHVSTAQSYQWARQLAGTSGFSVEVKELIAMENGDVYTAGAFSGTVDFDPGTGTMNKTAQDLDGFMARYDAGGNLVWVYTTNEAGDQSVGGINIRYVTNTSPVNVKCAVNTGTNGFYVVALSMTTGAKLANTPTYTSTGTVKVNAMSVYAHPIVDRTVLTGSFSGTFTVGGQSVVSAGGTDIFLADFLSNSSTWLTNGTLKRIGGTGNDEAFDITLADRDLVANGIGLVGGFEGTVDFDVDNVAVAELTSMGGKDAFFALLDNNAFTPILSGSVYRIGGAGNDYATTIRDIPGADYKTFVGGVFSGTVDFDPSAGITNLTSAGGEDGFVMMMSPTTFGWARKIGGTFNDRVDALDVSATSVYFTGSLGATATNSAPFVDTYTLTGDAESIGGIFFASATNTTNYGLAVGVNASGDVFSSGTFSRTAIDFDPGGGTASLTAVSTVNNGYIHKLSMCASASTPTISSTSTQACSGGSVTLSVNGQLKGNNTWTWYSGSCGGALIGTGASISVSPGVATTYFVRGEGGCAPNGACASQAITVTSPVAPSVTISTSTGFTEACSGTAVVFNAVPTNGGTTPSYQWKVNGTNAGTNSAMFTTTSLANGQVVTCVLTSSLTCVTSATATSNSVTMQIHPIPVVTVTPGSVCNSGSVTLWASSTPAGSMRWFTVPSGGTHFSTGASLLTPNITTTTTYYVEAVAAGCTSLRVPVVATVKASPTITSSAPDATCGPGSVSVTAIPDTGTISWYSALTGGTLIGTGGTYTTTITSTSTFYAQANHDGCSSPRTAVTATVEQVPIVAANDVSRCGRGPVDLEAGASTGLIHWYAEETGGIALATGANFTTPELHTTTMYYADAVSGVCASPSRIPVQAIVLDLPELLTVTQGERCDEGSVVLEATSTSGFVEWYDTPSAGTILGSDNLFNTPTLSSTTEYYVQAIDQNNCSSERMAVIATVNKLITPGITIDANASSICAGMQVTFTATPANISLAPMYEWKKNGIALAVPSPSAEIIISDLTDGDVVTVDLVPAETCVSHPVVTSNAIAISVGSALQPSVSVSGHKSVICKGETITFTATPVNGGISPLYQWKVNSVDVPGATAAIFVMDNLQEHDVVTCSMTSSLACAVTPTASSNAISVTVNDIPVITQTVSGEVCEGGSVELQASSPDGSINWFDRPSGGSVLSTGTTFTTPVLSQSTTYYAEASSNGCVSGRVSVEAIVSPIVTPGITIQEDQTFICKDSEARFNSTVTGGGVSPGYNWKINGVAAGTNSTLVTASLQHGDVVSCVLTSDAMCVTTALAESNEIDVDVTSIEVVAAIVNDFGIEVTAAGGTTPYQYSLDGNNFQADGLFTSLPNDTYTVTVRDANGCSGTSAQPVVITGVEPLIPVSAFPNPATDRLYLSGLSGRESIVVTDAFGRQVHKRESVKGLNVIYTREWKSGLYVLTIFDNHLLARRSLKIIIE